MEELLKRLKETAEELENISTEMHHIYTDKYDELDVKDMVYHLQFGTPAEQSKLDELIVELRECNLIP